MWLESTIVLGDIAKWSKASRAIIELHKDEVGGGTTRTQVFGDDQTGQGGSMCLISALCSPEITDVMRFRA